MSNGSTLRATDRAPSSRFGQRTLPPAALPRSVPRPCFPAGATPRSIARVRGGDTLPPHLRGAIMALGNFDGFHLGHQAVAALAAKLARERGVAAIVATFDPHPVKHFRPGSAPFQLSTLDQRQRLLADAGIDAFMVFAFDGALAQVAPEVFVDHWLRDVGGVVTGENFRFGHRRVGDVALLAALGKARGLACETLGPVMLGDDLVSSTRIRAAVRAGGCAAAARLLGRPFAIEGVLRPGRRLDPALTCPTASIDMGDYLAPRRGAYVVRARLADSRILGGSAYLAPPASVATDQRLELFLVDLREDDFGKRVEVELIVHLHEARATYDPPALRERIERDRRKASRILAAVPDRSRVALGQAAGLP